VQISPCISAAGPGPTLAAPPDLLLAPERVHPALWRAHQLGGQREASWASGFEALDAELPGQGWPGRALTELLLPHPGVGELRLLAPVLAAVQRAGRGVMLFDPPARPCAWTLAALGLDWRQLVLVQGRAGDAQSPPRPVAGRAGAGGRGLDLLWALEQALASGHAGAVLAWLPQRLPADALRRLQLAAQAHDGPAFLVREPQARQRPSASPLRLWLQPAGPDELWLLPFKRRGPPAAQPVRLALAPVLAAPARARALRTTAERAAPVAAGASV
jgi:protein ImuA